MTSRARKVTFVMGNIWRAWDQVKERWVPGPRPLSTWYEDARRWIGTLADTYGYDAPRIAAIIAVTSPMVSWQQQKLAIPPFLAGQPGPQPGFKSNWEKAERLRAGHSPIGQIVTGFKVKEFYLALAGFNQAVVVDRHMIRLAYDGEPMPPVSAEDMRMLFWAYDTVARKLNVPQTQFQATLWEWWREEWKDRKSKQETF